MVIDTELKRKIAGDIIRLKEIGAYRGRRHAAVWDTHMIPLCFEGGSVWLISVFWGGIGTTGSGAENEEECCQCSEIQPVQDECIIEG